MSRPTTYAWMILGLTAASAVGCRPTPRQTNPEAAQATLRQALDAWQRGVALDAFQTRVPTTTVVEPKWHEGIRLLGYEFQGNGEPSGFDVRFSVKLSLQDRANKKFQENAIYNVSTAPARVVVRSEGP